MPGHEIDISVHDGNWPDGIAEFAEDTIRKAMDIAFSSLGKPETLQAEVSIVLADNNFVQELNKTYRTQDKPTNVLSFPQTEPEEFDAAKEFVSLGDIILAHETLMEEAKAQDKDFLDHLTHLLVHGLLHLMHFDHMSESEAEEMETLEADILRVMGIKNPYEIH